jgi:hypothetical protein
MRDPGREPMRSQVLFKLGLVENGAGNACCPDRECHSQRLKLVMVTFTSGHSTTMTTEEMTKVTWRSPDEPAEQYMAVIFQCDRGHQFAVEMTYKTDEEDVTVGTASFVTRWERDSE